MHESATAELVLGALGALFGIGLLVGSRLHVPSSDDDLLMSFDVGPKDVRRRMEFGGIIFTAIGLLFIVRAISLWYTHQWS